MATTRFDLLARIAEAESAKDAKAVKNAKAALRRFDAKNGAAEVAPEAQGEPTLLEEVEAKAKAEIAEAKKTPKKTAEKVAAPKPTPAPAAPKPDDVEGQKWLGKVRETKTFVRIIDRKEVGEVAEGESRWVMECLEHGTVEPTKTYNQAWLLAAHPSGWCKKCGTAVAKAAAAK